MPESSPPMPALRPLQCERFESNRRGFMTAGRDREMIEEAQSYAILWIDENPDIQVVSIDTACAKVLTVVTVWYR